MKLTFPPEVHACMRELGFTYYKGSDTFISTNPYFYVTINGQPCYRWRKRLYVMWQFDGEECESEIADKKLSQDPQAIVAILEKRGFPVLQRRRISRLKALIDE